MTMDEMVDRLLDTIQELIREFSGKAEDDGEQSAIQNARALFKELTGYEP